MASARQHHARSGHLLARKDKVVEDLTKGVEFLFRKNKIDYIKGRGRIAGPGRVDVQLEGGGSQSLTAKNICIATGSEIVPAAERHGR